MLETKPSSLLLIDNFDSFTYNLFHLIQKCTEIPIVIKRNNQIDINEVANFSHVVFSPGPGLPDSAPIMSEVLQKYESEKKILGVCLGHQAIASYYGASLINLEQVYHGKSMNTLITTDNLLFKNILRPYKTARYHSWTVEKSSLPPTLETLAVDEHGEIMAIRHKTFNIHGIQFHPESILSEQGEQLINNWFRI